MGLARTLRGQAAASPRSAGSAVARRLAMLALAIGFLCGPPLRPPSEIIALFGMAEAQARPLPSDIVPDRQGLGARLAIGMAPQMRTTEAVAFGWWPANLHL